MPTTILDNESYPEALQRRYAEEAKNEENIKLIQMAEEACSPHQILNADLAFLKRFAALVAAREREKHGSPSWETVDDAIAAERARCVSKCMEIYKEQNPVSDYAQGKGDGALDCADAIEGIK